MTATHNLRLTTDGASSNNQSETDRQGGIGFIVSDGENVVTEQNEYLGQGELYTNNFAEYRAVVLGLEWIRDEYNVSTSSVEINSDSQLMIRQVRGEYSVNEAHLQEQQENIRGLLDEFEEYELEHRSASDDNLVNRADTLATEATQR